MTKLEAITKVQECMSSVFSKEDVIKLINQIEGGVNEDLALSIKSSIEMDITKMDDRQLIDFETAEFELSYTNQIELSHVSINLDYIMNIVEERLMELVEEEVEVVKANNEL